MVEREDEQGLAHYLEHLAFNGSENYPPGKLTEQLQAMGIGFGSHNNAHTGFEETVYKLDLPDAAPETLAIGLTVVSDYAGRMLQPAEVENERGIILAEMRDREGPGIRTWRVLYDAVYNGTNIGQRFPIGLKETVEAVTPELMRAFYERWYRPANMVLSVVGAVDPATAEQAVIAHFSDLASW